MRLAYVSLLAPGADYRVVTDIYRAARRGNAADGIHGFIVFDGSRFCSLVEGSSTAVARVRKAIEGDPRHVDVRVLLESESTAWAPDNTQWLSGYVDASAIDRVESVDATDVGSLERALDELVRGADLDDWVRIKESIALQG